MKMSGRKQVIGLVIWLALCGAVAVIGGIASMNAGSFYTTLSRPEWAPPAQLFGPVWTVLYAMMAIAAWLVWRERGWRGASVALTLFLVQLAVNALWSWLFFAWQMGGAAFADIVVLIVLVVLTIIAFWRIRPLAAAMLLPYLAWISFASALNYTVWQMNPQVL